MDPLYKPEDGESITKCLIPTQRTWEVPLCRDCGQMAYRIFSVRAADGTERTVALCGRHYIKACVQFPEVDALSPRDKKL